MTPDEGMRVVKVPFEDPSGGKEDVLVTVPDTGEPESEQVAEALQYVRSLVASGQLDYGDKKKRILGATHRLRRNPDGTRVLERIGFSAF